MTKQSALRYVDGAIHLHDVAVNECIALQDSGYRVDSVERIAARKRMLEAERRVKSAFIFLELRDAELAARVRDEFDAYGESVALVRALAA